MDPDGKDELIRLEIKNPLTTGESVFYERSTDARLSGIHGQILKTMSGQIDPVARARSVLRPMPTIFLAVSIRVPGREAVRHAESHVRFDFEMLNLAAKQIIALVYIPDLLEQTSLSIPPAPTVASSVPGATSPSWSLDEIDRPEGLLAVRESEQGPLGKTLVLPRPDPQTARLTTAVTVWQAVALSLDIEPASLGGYTGSTRTMLHERERARMDHRCRLAEEAFPSRRRGLTRVLEDDRQFNSTLMFQDFVHWAKTEARLQLPGWI